MINSRLISDLQPIVQRKAIDFLAKCGEQGIEVIVTSTFRDFESQAALYAIGRTVKGADAIPVVRPMGRCVTWVGPGFSYHNWRCAFDFVPLRYGKAVWGTSGADLALWMNCGTIAESFGLEWAGRWPKNTREFPHLQYTGGLTLADLQSGRVIT